MAEGGDLLCAPTAEDEEFQKAHTRSSCSYENRCARFRLRERHYATQYAHIYFTRLELMRPHVEAAAVKKWGEEVSVKTSLMEVKVEEKCCIVGTLFKKMELQPSILKEISAKHHLLPQPPRAKCVSSSDALVVEDSSQRIDLSRDIPAQELVTGVVVALLGRELKSGLFKVEDYTFAGLARQEPLTTSMETDKEEEKYVLLVSGLCLGSSWCDQLSVEMLVDYVTGQLGGGKDQKLCSNIIRVIIAGNSITDKPAKTDKSKDEKTKFQSRNYSADTIEAVRELDDILAQLASCVPVDLMPGSHDPANYQLPQQPLHPCMFPRARATGNLASLTNPYHAAIDGMLFTGCSGQNVEDIYKFSTLTDRLHILENTLQWRHMIPTAPDTLSCYPYTDKDPFILEECPHVYFCGNQPSFQSSRVQGDEGQSVLVVSVPSFDLTHSCVLIRLGEGGGVADVQELSFTSSLDHAHNPRQEQLLAQQREAERLGGEEEAEGGERGTGDVTLLHLMDDNDDDD